MTPPDPTNPSDPGPPYEDAPEGQYAENPEYDAMGEGVPQDRGRPSVSTGSAKVIVFAFGFLSIMVYIIYSLFFSPNPVEKKKEAVQPAKPSETVVSPPPAPPPAPMNVVESPPPPPPPPPPTPPPPPPTSATPGAATTAAPPPPPPPPPPAAGNATVKLPEARGLQPVDFNDKERQRRLKSNMMVLENNKNTGARAAAEAETGRAGEQLNGQDPNRNFSSNVLKASHAEKETATRVTGLSRTILQGKIIDGVLETAINTDLPGTLRAIISHDVYAESGRKVMIPKGSRLIGSYNTAIQRGQKRVYIVWTRLIRPDGIDIAIGSPAVDPLGRAGVNGLVDNKYMETFSTAFLTSLISIGIAVGADSVVKGPNTTTVNVNGSTTTGSAGAAAAGQAVTTFGQVAQDVVNSMLDLRPTITVDQGTRINVFVNRDLMFPEDGPGAVFIQ